MIIKCLLVMVVPLFTFLQIARAAQVVNKLDRVTLQVCTSFSAGHGAYALGIERKIFAEQGIDLELKEGKGCEDLSKSLSEGKVRFGLADPVVMSIANGDGADLELIFGLLQNTTTAYISLAESKLRTPRDYKGKKIAVVKGGRDKALLGPLLQVNGLSLSDVTVIEYAKPSDKYEALSSGQVDVAGHTNYEAPDWRRRSGKNITVMRPDTYGLSLPGDGIAISRKFGTKPDDHDLNCRMVAAVQKSWEVAVKDPDAAAQALLKISPKYHAADVEGIKESFALLNSLTQMRSSLKKPLGYIFIEDWQRLLRVISDFSLAKTVAPVESYFTNEFLDCARN